MKLFERPVAHYHKNKAWFVPYRRELDWPAAIDILAAIFDLDDPVVHESLDRMLDDGLIVIGSFFPSSGEIIVQVPLEPSEYVQKRIGEVLGDV